MALQGPKNVVSAPAAPVDKPDQYAELVERYMADTTRLTRVVKVLSVASVTAGVVGFMLGRSNTKQSESK